MRLSEAHIEQARTLKAEGMKVAAIAAKLSELYKIDVKPHHASSRRSWACSRKYRPATRKSSRTCVKSSCAPGPRSARCCQVWG